MSLKDSTWSLEEVELIELRYFNEIYWNLTNDKDKLVKLLTNKERIRESWEAVFKQETDQKIKSGLARGAERVLASLFPDTWLPNSTPIGSDLMYETVDAFIHIDVKTMVPTHMEKGKVPVGLNQTSYYVDDQVEIRGNLPFCYKLDPDTEPYSKLCLTYFIKVIHSEANEKYKSGDILQVDLICMPNGMLHTHYGNKIIGAGKSKNDSMRYLYQNQYFEKITNQSVPIKRAKLVYYDKSFADDVDEIIELIP